ncbi:NAD+ synthase [Seleniivibrio sp.]|uniref:NAD+ synthase n=1 Tax=Seleniivibrio sp. TaxID=2898801 RepID=UPI0025FA82AA|nr:NAD+ synthase [Seleniivibrio sp.]MCD8554053.1 NAD+ synthase [Seleniivibrio sp.]
MKLDLDLTVDILTNFIKDETEKIGLKNVVLGLSGGIDSALSAALAAKALGGNRVYAYCMPYKLSSDESLKDAMKVAETFRLNFDVIEITPMTDPYFEMMPDIDKLRMGNVMARQRMICLFDMSAKVAGLVLGTSNKTELLLGYGTWYGDLASALNPIGDLYKTQVWELSEYLGIPQSVVDKAPTADLWVGQTDEQELGFTYRQADDLLYAMVDERRRTPELIEMGFDEELVKKVAEKVRRNQFKRNTTVIAKVSQRTIGRDFRYCRDWGY